MREEKGQSAKTLSDSKFSLSLNCIILSQLFFFLKDDDQGHSDIADHYQKCSFRAVTLKKYFKNISMGFC